MIQSTDVTAVVLPLSSFTEHVGYGCGPGNNLETWRGKANEDCAAHCLDLPGCVGFLFQDTVCIFKSDTSGSSQSTGTTCYKRTQSAGATLVLGHVVGHVIGLICPWGHLSYYRPVKL